jgi:hypothetical protein
MNEDDEIRHAALYDSAYCAGLRRGFQLGHFDDYAGLAKALESREGYVKALREQRAAAHGDGR